MKVWQVLIVLYFWILLTMILYTKEAVIHFPGEGWVEIILEAQFCLQLYRNKLCGGNGLVVSVLLDMKG